MSDYREIRDENLAEARKLRKRITEDAEDCAKRGRKFQRLFYWLAGFEGLMAILMLSCMVYNAWRNLWPWALLDLGLAVMIMVIAYRMQKKGDACAAEWLKLRQSTLEPLPELDKIIQDLEAL